MEQYLSQLASVWGKYILPILEFIIGLGVIVFVHELGHFMVAKWVGIKVEQFAFGFGKRLCGFVVGETDYRINLIPLGGYVKMLGQEDFKPLKEGDKPDPRAFDQKSVGARFAVISAGVIMNVILAGVLFVIVAMVGMESPAPVIASVVPGTPAYNAVVHFEDAAPTPATAWTRCATRSISRRSRLPRSATATGTRCIGRASRRRSKACRAYSSCRSSPSPSRGRSSGNRNGSVAVDKPPAGNGQCVHGPAPFAR